MLDRLEALTKIPLYGGLLLLIGSGTAFWLTPSVERTQPTRARLWSTAVAAAATVVAFLLARLVAHTWLTFGGDGPFADNLSLIALQSRWGGGWRLQIGVAVVALAAVLLARVGVRAGAMLSTLAAVGLAVAYSQLGHSAGNVFTSTAASAHMVAGGAWLGTLGVLVLTRREGETWSRFSAVALAGAAAIALSGLALAASYFTSWRDLVETSYGRLFLTKLAAFAAIVGCGFLNWRAVRLTAGNDVRPPTAKLELALALLLVIVTAFLTETEHP